MSTTSAHEVMAVEPVIRRVVAARAQNPADIDDLVQDCLERLLAVRERLTPESVLPYAVVTARNLVSSHVTRAQRRALALPRAVEIIEPDRPEDVVLAEEARSAMMTALGRLSPQERSDILAYYHPDPAPADRPPQSSGALRVRMARTRAKLRLEYLLAFRKAELPSPACYRVLLAISGGDTRRQRELKAGEHLLDCRTCAMLSEPLNRRSIALTAFILPAGLAAWLLAKVRAHPVHAAAATTVAGAAVAAAVVLTPGAAPAHPAPAPSPASTSAPAPRPHVKIISDLAIGGRAVTTGQAHDSIRSMVGEPATASGVSVVSVVTRNGFWIGSAGARIWVELTGPLKPLRIRPHDRLWFTGTVARNTDSYARRVGVTTADDASLLTRQGAHLSVSTTKIHVRA